MTSPIKQETGAGREALGLEEREGAVSTEVDRPSRETWQRHAACLLFIAAVIAAMFWRVLFLGETLIDVATLNNQLPWGYSAGSTSYPYDRRDLTDMYVTRDYFVVAAYRDGEMPMWNPYTMAGHPIYADGVTKTLSPFLLFYKFLDVPLGYSVARITELLLAAFFMYIFLVSLGAGSRGGIVGSLVFAFSAHSMLHLTGLGWWGGLMWLPLVMMFSERAVRRGSYVQAVLAGLFLAAQFFCGYMPNQIYYAGAVVLLYGFFGARGFAKTSVSGESPEPKSRTGGSRLRTLPLLLATLAVGFGLSATQWLPVFELLEYSNRRIVPTEIGYIYLPPWYALTLVFPNLFGAAYDAQAVNLFTALNVSHDHILYVGIAALAPIGFSLYWLRRRDGDARVRGADRETGGPRNAGTGRGGDGKSGGQGEGTGRSGGSELFVSASPVPASPPPPVPASSPSRERILFFSLLAGISLVLMMAAPLYVHITRFIPVLQSIRVIVRVGVLFLFAASVLAGLGTNLLFKGGVDSLARFAACARKFVWGCVVFVALSAAASAAVRLSGFAFEDTGRGAWAFLHRAALKLSAQFLPPDMWILVPLLLIFGTFGLITLAAKRRIERRSFVAVLTTLLVADLVLNGKQFNPSFDRSLVFPSTQTTDLLRSLPPGRVLVTPSSLERNRRVGESEGEKIIAPPNTLLPYQIATVTGKDQLFPKSYREFCSMIEPQPNLSHVVFNQASSSLFDLLNVRYVVTHAAAPAPPDSELLRTCEGLSIYENKKAMPRGFFAREVKETASRDEAAEFLINRRFDPAGTVLIEESTDGTRDDAGHHKMSPVLADGLAVIREDTRNRVTIETASEADGLLVLSDNYYPGWRATLDSVPIEILQANHTMRAVRVPAGRHVVSFEFSPAILRTATHLSMAAAAVVSTVLLIGVFRSRRRRADEE